MKRLALPLMVSIAAHASLLVLLSGVIAFLGRNDRLPLSGSGSGGAVTVEIVGEGEGAQEAQGSRLAVGRESRDFKLPSREKRDQPTASGERRASLPGSGAGAGAPGTGSGPGGGTNAVLGEIRARIERAKRYPLLLRQSGVEGVAQVGFRISAEGRPESITLKSSSGSPALDEEALATIRRAAPYPLYDDALNIGIRFELKD